MSNGTEKTCGETQMPYKNCAFTVNQPGDNNDQHFSSFMHDD